MAGDNQIRQKLTIGKWINKSKEIYESKDSYEYKKDQIQLLCEELLGKNGLREQIDLKTKLHHHDIPKTLSTLANRLSKFPKVEKCKEVSIVIANESKKKRIKDFDAQGLSNLTNTFSKWPQEEKCKDALRLLWRSQKTGNLKSSISKSSQILRTLFPSGLKKKDAKTSALRLLWRS